MKKRRSLRGNTLKPYTAPPPSATLPGPRLTPEQASSILSSAFLSPLRASGYLNMDNIHPSPQSVGIADSIAREIARRIDDEIVNGLNDLPEYGLITRTHGIPDDGTVYERDDRWRGFYLTDPQHASTRALQETVFHDRTMFNIMTANPRLEAPPLATPYHAYAFACKLLAQLPRDSDRLRRQVQEEVMSRALGYMQQRSDFERLNEALQLLVRFGRAAHSAGF